MGVWVRSVEYRIQGRGFGRLIFKKVLFFFFSLGDGYFGGGGGEFMLRKICKEGKGGKGFSISQKKSQFTFSFFALKYVETNEKSPPPIN